MRIRSLAHVLAFPFAIIFAIILYLSSTNSYYDLSWMMIPPAIVVVMIYIMAPQINFWWIKRNPPPIDLEIKRWLTEFSPFYKSLDQTGKEKFEARLSIFIEAKEFFSMGSERTGMPDDMKAVLAHQAIRLTYYREDYFFTDYERLVFYKHPFPSPKCQFLHTVETEHEDGVFLWSMEHALPGLTRRSEFYNIILHAFIEAFIHKNNNLAYPQIMDKHIPQLELISGFTHERILSLTGFPKISLVCVAINYYFTFPDRFEQFLPVAYTQLEKIFGPTQTLS